MLRIHQRLLEMMELINQPSTFSTVQCMLQIHSLHSKSILKYFVFRRACSIANVDTRSVIITGGQQGNGVRSTVSRYNQTGWITNLPSLKEGRQGHGCGSYESESENMVVSCIQAKGTTDYRSYFGCRFSWWWGVGETVILFAPS